MTIFQRTISDGTEVSDDSTPARREFCWTGHVHFLARDVREARMLLARYFDMEESQKADKMFVAGQMTLGPAVIIHQPQANMEVSH